MSGGQVTNGNVTEMWWQKTRLGHWIKWGRLRCGHKRRIAADVALGAFILCSRCWYDYRDPVRELRAPEGG